MISQLVQAVVTARRHYPIFWKCKRAVPKGPAPTPSPGTSGAKTTFQYALFPIRDLICTTQTVLVRAGFLDYVEVTSEGAIPGCSRNRSRQLLQRHFMAIPAHLDRERVGHLDAIHRVILQADDEHLVLTGGLASPPAHSPAQGRNPRGLVGPDGAKHQESSSSTSSSGHSGRIQSR